MNGVHDMGGMHGMGPIVREENEPVFHARWEGRVYAMNAALMAFRRWTLDAWRSHIEGIPPHEYLRMSYYEKWFDAMRRRVVDYGFVTPEELQSGRPAPGSAKARPALTVAMAQSYRRNLPSPHDPSIRPRFDAGQRVRARNLNPTGHTRLPRYARGKIGEIFRDHGVHDFPDTSAAGLGPGRQHLYSVRFSARELWGEAASPRDSVHLDLWDDYLEPV